MGFIRVECAVPVHNLCCREKGNCEGDFYYEKHRPQQAHGDPNNADTIPGSFVSGKNVANDATNAVTTPTTVNNHKQ